MGDIGATQSVCTARAVGSDLNALQIRLPIYHAALCDALGNLFYNGV